MFSQWLRVNIYAYVKLLFCVRAHAFIQRVKPTHACRPCTTCLDDAFSFVKLTIKLTFSYFSTQ